MSQSLTVKTTISTIVQYYINEKVNGVGAIADGFLPLGYGDFAGSMFDVGYDFDPDNKGLYSETILGNKSMSKALIEGTIGTIFSLKMHGFEKYAPGLEKSIMGQAAVGFAVQFGNSFAQKKIAK